MLQNQAGLDRRKPNQPKAGNKKKKAVVMLKKDSTLTRSDGRKGVKGEKKKRSEIRPEKPETGNPQPEREKIKKKIQKREDERNEKYEEQRQMLLLPRNARGSVTRSRCSRPKLLLGSSLFRASLASSLVPRETIGEAEIGGPSTAQRESRVAAAVQKAGTDERGLRCFCLRWARQVAKTEDLICQKKGREEVCRVCCFCLLPVIVKIDCWGLDTTKESKDGGRKGKR
ncbi:hypothetical protein V8C26DRAFT_386045 [Trichoderma gracile]